MAASVRQGEEKVFQNLLDNKKIPYTRLKKANIEGGDILIADGTVYAGLSERTDKAAVRELQEAAGDDGCADPSQGGFLTFGLCI